MVQEKFTRETPAIIEHHWLAALMGDRNRGGGKEKPGPAAIGQDMDQVGAAGGTPETETKRYQAKPGTQDWDLGNPRRTIRRVHCCQFDFQALGT